MPKFSKREFADLCGMQTKNLAVYIGRQKLEVGSDGLIDDSNSMNKLFMEKRRSKPQGVKANPEKAMAVAETEKSGLLKNAEAKAELDLLKRQNEIDLQRLEITKKRGELVPVQAVKSLIVLQSQSQRTAYLQASENFLIIISQKKQLSSTELTDLKMEFHKIVNKAIDDAVNTSQATLKGLVVDFQKKRGVGQHG